MGSKSKAPPPNPELTAVQIQSLKAQERIANRQMELMEEMQPLQMESMKFGLESQRTAFQQSQEDRAYALGKRDKYDAALQPFLDKAIGFDEGARRAELSGEADKYITQTFGSATEQQQRAMGRMGLSSTALQSQAAQQQAKMAEATARAGTGHAISTQAKQEGMQAKTDAVNMLAGFPPQASQLAVTGAGIAGGSVAGTNAGVSGIQNSMSAASRIFGNVGQQASSLWNTQAQAKYQADSAAAAQKNQMVGSAAAVAMMAVMMMSDRRLKENIRRIGTTPGGFPLYMFNFKGKDPSEVEFGVMADEVELVRPDAVHQVGLYKAVDYSKV